MIGAHNKGDSLCHGASLSCLLFFARGTYKSLSDVPISNVIPRYDELQTKGQSKDISGLDVTNTY